MSKFFDAAFARVLGIEGKFSDDPTDHGGATMYGITERVARANGYTGPMKEMPLAVAKRIAKSQYWDLLSLDAVADLSPPVAEEMFDTSYNMGVGTAGRFLQRALSAFDRDPVRLTADGVIGPLTITRLTEFLRVRADGGATVLMSAMNALQGSRYIEIAESNPTQERFTYGWFRQRVKM